MKELRASAKEDQAEVDYRVTTGMADGDGGVVGGELLVELAESVARWQWKRLAEMRDRCIKRFGAQGASDAILVAAGFNGITRVADATGIPLDPTTESATIDLRAATGINDFAPAAKWKK